MATKYVINNIFKAKDQVTKVFKRMSKSADVFGNRSTKAFKKASKGATSFKSITGGILGAGAVTRGLGLLQQGIGGVAREYVSFDDAIFGATARFQDAQEKGADVVKIMKDLRIAARQTGATTQFTASQAAQGLDFYARAGFKSAEAIAVLKSQIDLATSSGEEFAQITDWTSDLLGSFGGANLESAKKIGILKEMSAQLGVAVNTANVKVEDLFETLKIAAPVATGAGGNMKEIIAVTAALGSAGIKGTLGATAIKNIFVRLVKPTKEARKALGGLGIEFSEFTDKKGDMLSVTKILEKVGKATKDLGKAKKLAIFAELFGLRAAAGSLIIEQNIDRITKSMVKLGTDPQSQLKRLADFMRGSLGNQLKILQSSAIELGFKFLEAFDKDGRQAIEGMTKAIQQFDPKKFIAGMRDIADSTKKMIGPLLTVIKVASKFNKIFMNVLGITASRKAFTWLHDLANSFGVTSESIGASWENMASRAMAAWDNSINFIKTKFNNIKNTIKSVFNSDLKLLLVAPFAPLLAIMVKISSMWDKFSISKTLGATGAVPQQGESKELSGITPTQNNQLARLIIENNTDSNATLQSGNSSAPPVWATLQAGAFA